MSAAGFEPATQGIERVQTYALDYTATEIGQPCISYCNKSVADLAIVRRFVLLPLAHTYVSIPVAPITLYSMLFQLVQYFEGWGCG
jgi:hypothetical protein